MTEPFIFYEIGKGGSNLFLCITYEQLLDKPLSFSYNFVNLNNKYE